MGGFSWLLSQAFNSSLSFPNTFYSPPPPFPRLLDDTEPPDLPLAKRLADANSALLPTDHRFLGRGGVDAELLRYGAILSALGSGCQSYFASM